MINYVCRYLQERIIHIRKIKRPKRTNPFRRLDQALSQSGIGGLNRPKRAFAGRGCRKVLQASTLHTALYTPCDRGDCFAFCPPHFHCKRIGIWISRTHQNLPNLHLVIPCLSHGSFSSCYTGRCSACPAQNGYCCSKRLTNPHFWHWPAEMTCV